MRPLFKAYVFDAYGTLFDVHSAVTRHAGEVGDNPARVSEIWRTKQLEYTWVRSGLGKYRDFWKLTEDALDFALRAVPGSNQQARKLLLDAYRELDCYGEVPETLNTLKASGAKVAILSNGTPEMLESAVNSAGIAPLLDNVFSVDEIGVFKTDPATYALVTNEYGFNPGEIAFQSSNRWDIAGATSFGFKCHWINRTSQPDEYEDLAPEQVLENLDGLV
ncbi:MAG: haloacid dehalogenase type II [Rhizobiaceae bacterium]|nr:haloacid dehalogenase type II [Rhizobiaceae bacterium]